MLVRCRSTIVEQTLQSEESTDRHTRLRLIGEAITRHRTQHPFRYCDLLAIRTSNNDDRSGAVAAKISNHADFYAVERVMTIADLR
jgi:hypothetical protein